MLVRARHGLVCASIPGCYSNASLLCCPASLPALSVPPQSTRGQGFFGYNPAWTEQGGESPGLFACALQCLSPLPPTELQAKLLSSEAEVKSKLLELDSVKGKLQDASSENTKLLERIKSIEALLEAGQMREAEKDRNLQVVCSFNWGGRRGVGDTAYTIPVLSLLWDPLWDATERADMHHMPGAGNQSAFSLPGSQ